MSKNDTSLSNKDVYSVKNNILRNLDDDKIIYIVISGFIGALVFFMCMVVFYSLCAFMGSIFCSDGNNESYVGHANSYYTRLSSMYNSQRGITERNQGKPTNSSTNKKQCNQLMVDSRIRKIADLQSQLNSELSYLQNKPTLTSSKRAKMQTDLNILPKHLNNDSSTKNQNRKLFSSNQSRGYSAVTPTHQIQPNTANYNHPQETYERQLETNHLPNKKYIFDDNKSNISNSLINYTDIQSINSE